MNRIWKAAVAWLLAALLCGCGWQPSGGNQQYSVTYWDVFDTVTTISGFASNEEEFQTQAEQIHRELLEYHRLFDIYNDYEGINNLKTVNDRAGVAPVQVDGKIVALLQDCVDYYAMTEGLVNVAMGSVLSLWHDARNAGLLDPDRAALPEQAALENAALHGAIGDIVLDKENSTVYLADPEMSLDVGAVAKGWATQRVAENAPEGMLLSVGGNVCATGPKANGSEWTIGVQDPDSNENLHTVALSAGALVTSGDYQRTYTVDGKQYHHIIDPATQMPGGCWRSVTVFCGDSALADALSTALFLLPLEQGQALAEKWGAEALWIDDQGREFMTDGFREMLRS